MLKHALPAAIVLVAAGAHNASAFAVETYALTADTANSGFNWAAYNAQLDGGPFGVVDLGSYGSQTQSGLGDPPSAAGLQSGTVSASPSLTAAWDLATTTRLDSGATATAYAAGDLAAGTLRAQASGGSYVNGYTYDVQARAFAQFGDGLTFSVPGATAATVTDIGFNVHTDGFYGGAVGNPAESILAGLTVSQAGNGQAQYFAGYDFTNNTAPTMSYDVHSGWLNYSFTGGPGNYTFTGVYAATGADPYLTFGEVLYAIGSTGYADYSHTSRISLQLPSGVTYTSDSGVFLNAVAAVPEPSSWMVMLTGFGLIGAAARRRRPALARWAWR